MAGLAPERDLPWRALESHALFLDVDGTLLDIAATPGAVTVPQPLVADLAIVARRLGGALALVSGRPIAALDSLFHPWRCAAIGIHGGETRAAGAPVHTADHLARQLDGVRSALSRQVAQWPGALLEDKGIALAAHYRGSRVDEGVIGRAMRELAALAGPEFTLLHGKCVFEIKPATLSKASGIAALRAAAPFANRAPVCVGDDETDESAFEYANAHDGWSICVGDRRPTQARHRVASPADVRHWLARLAATAEEGP